MIDDDDSSRTGVWVALGTALLVTLGTVLWLAWGSLDDGDAAAAKPAPAAATAPATTAATAAPLPTAGDVVVDVPLTGDLLGKVYFALGKADVGADGTAIVDKAAAAITESARRKVVLSGFHDLSGDPAQNAELAKERAKAVRAMLEGKGIGRDRIVMRKPAETGAGGPAEEARRVEIRLVD